MTKSTPFLFALLALSPLTHADDHVHAKIGAQDMVTCRVTEVDGVFDSYVPPKPGDVLNVDLIQQTFPLYFRRPSDPTIGMSYIGYGATNPIRRYYDHPFLAYFEGHDKYDSLTATITEDGQGSIGMSIKPGQVVHSSLKMRCRTQR